MSDDRGVIESINRLEASFDRRIGMLENNFEKWASSITRLLADVARSEERIANQNDRIKDVASRLAKSEEGRDELEREVRELRAEVQKRGVLYGWLDRGIVLFIGSSITLLFTKIFGN